MFRQSKFVNLDSSMVRNKKTIGTTLKCIFFRCCLISVQLYCTIVSETPTFFTFQGKGLVFRVIRLGFEDIYLSSLGSFFDKYGMDYFICTGPAAMLVPVTVNPGEEWRGAQVIEHDNLT